MTTSNQPSAETGYRHPEGPPPVWRVVAAFAAIYVIWGSTYLGIRFAIQSVPPFLMAGSRFVAAGLLLYGFVRWRGAPAPVRSEWRDAAIAGGLMLAVGNGGVTWAEQVVPSSAAALLAALTPVWMVLLDWLRPNGVRPKPLVIAGLVVGFVGIVLLARGNQSGGGTTYGWGVVALLTASLGWAAGSVFQRQARKPSSSLAGGAMQMICGGVLLLAAGGLRGELGAFAPARFTTASVSAWIYLTLFGSLVGFTAYVWLLRVSTPARLSTYAYVNPLIAVLLGCTIGHESVSRALLAAGSLIVLSVILIVRSKSARPAPNQAAAAPTPQPMPGRATVTRT